jgi:hypothetical protein
MTREINPKDKRRLMPIKKTTEKFIEDAVAMHGSFYNYSKVSYVNAEIKVRIGCPIHGDFIQLPVIHTRGGGCKLCADENLRKPGLTNKDFISKAVALHGAIYDYSKVIYVSTRKKVCIVCPVHGEFFQKPNSHLQGKGCSLCVADGMRLTLDQFVKKANIKHNGRYSYEKALYRGHREKVCVICSIHGEFNVISGNHLRGAGCPKCGRLNSMKAYFQKKINTAVFIKKSIEIHGREKYDYSVTEYKGSKCKVTIICKTHGKFYQEPFKHLKGSGCKKCSVDIQKLTLSEFISNSNSIHGEGKYDYSKIKDLANGREKVCIVCPIHGEFLQRAGAHSLGSGCKKCSDEQLSNDRSLGKEEFIHRSQEVHKNLYDYSKVVYKNTNTKVCITCKDHGDFYQRPGSHMRSCGCPLCKHSIGERIILNWFKKRNIEINHHFSYPDLLGLGGKSLEFDFYVKHLNSLIEYDGEQHFKPVRFNGISEEKAKEQFRVLQHHDALKNQYCTERAIPLLRISYKEFKRIPEILTENALGG